MWRREIRLVKTSLNSMKSGQTATPDLFRLFLPDHLDNDSDNNNDVCGYK
jgi:hypothetical protein